MPDPDSKYRRRYDREFKAHAVALVRSGRTQTEVARDLDVSVWSLGEWIKKDQVQPFLASPAPAVAESPAERELRLLRQENQHLRQQSDILKKALGILSAEMPENASPSWHNSKHNSR